MESEGRILQIAEYCCFDVKITRLVHEYGAAHKRLHYSNKYGKKLSVAVTWWARSSVEGGGGGGGGGIARIRNSAIRQR